MIIITLLVIFYYPAKQYFDLTQTTAYVNKSPTRKWNVVGSYENHAAAAKLMAQTNATMIEFFRYLKHKYHIDEPDDIAAGHDHKFMFAPNDLYNIVDNLLNNYDPDSITENNPKYSSDTSWTSNKGVKTYFCLRNKLNPDKLIDTNTLLYVWIHESAHMANYNDWGHSEKFWAVFKFLLHEARLAGIYKPVDYEKYPVNYCGLTLTTNTLFDPTVKNLWE